MNLTGCPPAEFTGRSDVVGCPASFCRGRAPPPYRSCGFRDCSPPPSSLGESNNDFEGAGIYSCSSEVTNSWTSRQNSLPADLVQEPDTISKSESICGPIPMLHSVSMNSTPDTVSDVVMVNKDGQFDEEVNEVISSESQHTYPKLVAVEEEEIEMVCKY